MGAVCSCRKEAGADLSEATESCPPAPLRALCWPLASQGLPTDIALVPARRLSRARGRNAAGRQAEAGGSHHGWKMSGGTGRDEEGSMERPKGKERSDRLWGKEQDLGLCASRKDEPSMS
ncbi:Sperm Acrosome Membrane-Associated Protein 1 [Manis pentadactyla]|nr:Sperm Acrosome Membrane-Associated Protein 1 [Manis pentadactyla]